MFVFVCVLGVVWFEFKVLSFGDSESNCILDYLYSVLANEIQQAENTNARITYLRTHSLL